MELVPTIISSMLILRGKKAYECCEELFLTEEDARAYLQLLEYVQHRQGPPPPMPFPVDPLVLTPPPYPRAARRAALKKYVTARARLLALVNHHVPVEDVPRLRALCGPAFQLLSLPTDMKWRMEVVSIMKLLGESVTMYKFGRDIRLNHAKTLVRKSITHMRQTSALTPSAHEQLAPYLDVIETLLFGRVRAVNNPTPGVGVCYQELADAVGLWVNAADSPDTRLAWAIASRLEDNMNMPGPQQAGAPDRV